MAPHWFRYVSSVFSLKDLFGFSLSGGDILEYFQELCSILTRPQGESKLKQGVKIPSNTTHQKVS